MRGRENTRDGETVKEEIGKAGREMVLEMGSGEKKWREPWRGNCGY